MNKISALCNRCNTCVQRVAYLHNLQAPWISITLQRQHKSPITKKGQRTAADCTRWRLVQPESVCEQRESKLTVRLARVFTCAAIPAGCAFCINKHEATLARKHTPTNELASVLRDKCDSAPMVDVIYEEKARRLVIVDTLCTCIYAWKCLFFVDTSPGTNNRPSACLHTGHASLIAIRSACVYGYN
jgi:hypothetical protein